MSLAGIQNVKVERGWVIGSLEYIVKPCHMISSKHTGFFFVQEKIKDVDIFGSTNCDFPDQ